MFLWRKNSNSLIKPHLAKLNFGTKNCTLSQCGKPFKRKSHISFCVSLHFRRILAVKMKKGDFEYDDWKRTIHFSCPAVLGKISQWSACVRESEEITSSTLDIEAPVGMHII